MKTIEDFLKYQYEELPQNESCFKSREMDSENYEFSEKDMCDFAEAYAKYKKAKENNFYKRGQLVQVSDDEYDWKVYKYFANIEGIDLVYEINHSCDLTKKDYFKLYKYNYIKPAEYILTIQELREKLGIQEGVEIKIID